MKQLEVLNFKALDMPAHVPATSVGIVTFKK